MVLHFAFSSKRFNHINSDWLKSLDQEKDFSIILSSKLKVANPCLKARNKANNILGIINHNVAYKSKIISKMYNSYVRPLLVLLWTSLVPYLRKDVQERVQQEWYLELRVRASMRRGWKR